MPDIAALNLAAKYDSVEGATVALKEMVPAATAAEKTTQRFTAASNAASAANENFSKRVQGTIKSLTFEKEQLTRTAAEQAKYAALRRAGVSAMSAEGRAIAESVAALQAQRAATQGVAASTGLAGTAATAAAGAFRTLWLVLGPLAIAMLAVQQATKAWDAGMKAANLGEEAEQVNLTTDALQAFRFQAVQNGVEVATLDQAMIRLTASMGQAAQGGKDQIETFQNLGVKLLDSNGKLRATADVLPEVARGLLAMESGTERNAMLTEMFGKSGARVVTMLQDWAQGTDMVINKARAQGGVLEADVIAQWDKVADSLAKAGAAAEVTFANLGAPIATWALEKVAALLDSINTNLARLKQEAATITVRTAKNDAAEIESQIAAQRGLLAINPNNQMALASIKGLEARLAAAKNAAGLAEMQAQQGAIQAGGAPSANVSQVLPTITVSSTGASNPTPKGGASGSAGAKTAIDEAAKAAEKLASWMRDANVSFETFMANQEIQRQSLFLSSEAASALKIETDFLNKAKADDVVLTEQQRAALASHAAQMAASEEKTRQFTEAFEFARDTFHGFLTDLRQGILDGKSFWESFGNAGLNALNAIANKLFEMAANKLFESAFGGSSGGGGGLLGRILSSIIGGVAGGASGGFASTDLGTFANANGNVFRAGNVIPFARGGVVSRPTLFPMANGMGLMGEAGPEAVMPLRRGPGGRLGVSAHGGGQTAPVIRLEVTGDTGLVRVIARDESGKMLAQHEPRIEANAVRKANRSAASAVERDRAERDGDYRA